MSDQNQNSTQQMIVYALVAIAVLLAVVVGFMVYKQMNNAVPAPTTATTTTSAAQNPATGSQTPATTEGTFDKATATKLPSGVTPEQALKQYNEAVKSGKFDAAFKLLPQAQQQSYGTAAAMGEQIKQYGITGYKLGTAQTDGNNVVIVSEQDTPAMNITYTWTYTKDGSTWYVKSRVMGGTLQ